MNGRIETAEAVINMDGWDQELMYEHQVLSSRDFDHKGRKVHEKVVTHAGKFKLLWCMAPFDDLQVGGKHNMLVHVIYNDRKDEADARDKVRKSFDMYWGVAS